MRWDIPLFVLTLAIALLLWYAARTRSRASEVRFRGSDGAAGGRPGEEPRSVSGTRGGIMPELLLDAAGRRRSPATLPEFHAGRPPRNKGMRSAQADEQGGP